MERPIGVEAQNKAIEFEHILRNVYGNVYLNSSDELRNSLYDKLVEVNLSSSKNNKQIEFINKYFYLEGESIDSILEREDGIELLDEIKKDLKEII